MKRAKGYYSESNAAAELKNAVDSIPGYIEFCEHFVVLCPARKHKDLKLKDGSRAINNYASWRRRGWCRTEAMARLLMRKSGPMILVDSLLGTPQLLPSFDAWSMQPGKGEFTCCKRDHLFRTYDKTTGKKKLIRRPCDRKKVAEIGEFFYLFAFFIFYG